MIIINLPFFLDTVSIVTNLMVGYLVLMEPRLEVDVIMLVSGLV